MTPLPMTPSSYPRLLGDIGATNARFGWQDRGGAISAPAVYRCSETPTLQATIRRYLDDHARSTPPVCALGIAEPVTDDLVRMTNHPWQFSIAELRREFGFARLLVLNDFAALALALPALGPEDLRPLGGGVAIEGAPCALIGPGTGLGVSGLVQAPAGHPIALSGEGGHVTLAAGNDAEAEVVRALRRRFGHASAERALSGPGLVNLYEVACGFAGVRARALAPADVTAGARAGSDAQCTQALAWFCSLLGGVAGNLALTLGARGGVFIGGGIALRIHAELERSNFRERFEGKGRFRDYLQGIPTLVIDARVPAALVGAARALEAAEGAPVAGGIETLAGDDERRRH